MHGYPVMQVVQYSVPPCSWAPPVDSHRSSQPTTGSQRSGVRKYVIWCLICGGLSCLLGIMFLGVYFLVRSYTSTIGYFETVPTFVPATLLMLTGLCIISLARRRNRYSYLIKLSGACGLSSALTCALVTVTTTVIHMSRLQALRECEYTRKTRTCTCYSIETHAMQDDNGNIAGNDEIGYRFVFDSADECTVVHNALYSCLRAIFGISVAGVLVAVFSCMLVYQLLSHERKKMIWEQLELRRRQAYGRQSPPGWPSLNGPSIIGTPRNGSCRCCEQCHSHRNMMPSTYSWDSDNRFWSPPQNGYYAQGDDHMIVSRMVNQNTMQTQRPGWSWPRFPWQRNDTQRFPRQTPSSPDSQYGFSTNMPRLDSTNMMQSYTLINGPHHFGIWGPPPPYSDPNSPVRRGRYQYSHTNQCQQLVEPPGVVLPSIQSTAHQANVTQLDCTQPIVTENHSIEQICSTPTHSNHRIKHRLNAFKIKDTGDSGALSDSDTQRDSTQSNTLPFRKARKKIENGAKSIGPHQSTSRVNVQTVFSSTQNMSTGNRIDIGRAHENIGAGCSSNFVYKTKTGPNNGVDNTGFHSVEDDQIIDTLPQEIYVNEIGNRDVFMRNRLQFVNRDYEKLNAFNSNIQLPSTSLRTHSSSHSLPKDLTRYSICSAESGEKTDYTDLSPMTPSTPHSAKDSNAIGLAFQREMKHQQPQQLQPQQVTHTKVYKDMSEASGSSNQVYNSRYYDSIEAKRDAVNNLTPKSLHEIHLRPIVHNANVTQNSHITAHDTNPTYDNLNAVNAPAHYAKFERSSVYQRPTYSFASAHSTPGHSHSTKYNSLTTSITPKKRRVHGTQSLALATSSGVSSIGDLSTDLQRLANIRKESAKDDPNHTNQDERQPTPFDSHSSHNKTLNETEWSDHSSGDRRL